MNKQKTAPLKTELLPIAQEKYSTGNVYKNLNSIKSTRVTEQNKKMLL